jgi:hypothetical protein
MELRGNLNICLERLIDPVGDAIAFKRMLSLVSSGKASETRRISRSSSSRVLPIYILNRLSGRESCRLFVTDRPQHLCKRSF